MVVIKAPILKSCLSGSLQCVQKQILTEVANGGLSKLGVQDFGLSAVEEGVRDSIPDGFGLYLGFRV